VVPLQEQDGYMQDQIVPMLQLLNDGKVLAAAEGAVGAMN
jgi:histidine ammonia-lyase